jgi:glycine betaine catabolism A
MTDRYRWLEGVRATLAVDSEARQLPGEAYGEAGFTLDAAIFRDAWLPVAHASELAVPGTFVACEVFGERIVIVRGADLELRAFYDRCLHRGTPLTEGACGRAERLELVCPYHGLAYDLRGRPDGERARSLGVVAESLEAAPLAERFGFVFVAASPPRRALADETAPPWLERASMGLLRLARRSAHEVAANWKLLVQNFQESHHFPTVHPSLEAKTPAMRSTSQAFGGRFLGGTMEIVPGAETVSDSGRLSGRPFVAAEPDRRRVGDAHLFPGWLTSLQPDYFLSYGLMPLSPDRTRVVADIYVHAAAPQAADDALHAFWDRTNAEDRAICERQQRGVSSPSYRPGPYAPSEDGMRAFDRLVAAAYLGAGDR